MLSWKGNQVQLLKKKGKFWSQKVLEMCSKGGLRLHCLLFPALSVCLRMCITTLCNRSSCCVPGWEQQHWDLCVPRHWDLAGGIYITGTSLTVEAVSVSGEGAGTEWSLRSLPTQTIPWLHDSIRYKGSSWEKRKKSALPMCQQGESSSRTRCRGARQSPCQPGTVCQMLLEPGMMGRGLCLL